MLGHARRKSQPSGGAFNAFASEPPAACRQTKRAPFSPYGGLGITFAGALTSRLAFASSLDITVGSTHRIGEQSRAGGVGVSSGWAEGEYPAMTYELAYRLGATGRVLLGGSRRGYLGTGIRVGYRMQVGEVDRSLVPHNPNPDGAPYTFSPAPRGFTAEALLEGGVSLREAHPVSLGVVVGAGRPRLRAELVMSFPFAIGAR